MRKSAQRVVLVASMAVAAVLADATRAMAQIVQSEIETEPGSTETTQLVTSNTEVRRAVLGLLTLAFITGVLAIIYWYKTGQQARHRFARNYGGRHLAGQGRHDVMDERGHWGTEAAMIQPVFATQETHGQPTLGSHGVAGRAFAEQAAMQGATPPPSFHGTDHQPPPQRTPGVRPTWEPSSAWERHRPPQSPPRAQHTRRA